MKFTEEKYVYNENDESNQITHSEYVLGNEMPARKKENLFSINIEEEKSIVTRNEGNVVSVHKRTLKIHPSLVGILAGIVLTPFVIFACVKFWPEKRVDLPQIEAVDYGSREKNAVMVETEPEPPEIIEKIDEPVDNIELSGISLEEQNEFYECLELLKNKKYEEGAARFLKFHDMYPNSTLFFDVQYANDYQVWIEGEGKSFQKALQYWKCMGVDEAWMGVTYCYLNENDTDYAYCIVHDPDNGVWYYFTGDGRLVN